MKYLLLVAFCLGLFALSQAVPPFCCTTNQWSGMVASWDPQMTFFSFGYIAYDYTNMREFFTAIEMEGNDRVNVTYILDYNLQKGYRVYTYFGGDRCKEFPLNGPMQQYCIPNGAVFRGNFTIGQTLWANAWELIQGDTKAYLQITSSGCIPIRATGQTFGRNPNVDKENYFNIVNSVNPAVFTAPSFCG